MVLLVVGQLKQLGVELIRQSLECRILIGGVVDPAHIEVVKDRVGVLEGHLRGRESRVQQRRQRLVEVLGGRQHQVVRVRRVVVVAADSGLLAVTRALQPGGSLVAVAGRRRGDLNQLVAVQG